ncbi:MAG: cytochrome c maturation protein CcmE [Candidatus Zixiibacteriota bacterium]
MTAKYIIGGVIIVVFLIWGTTAFLKTTIQYVPIEQAISAKQKVQVMGKIDFDVVKYNADESRLEFAIYDAEASDMDGAQRMDVVYHGVVPGNFDQATSVVLKGMPKNSVFVADQMLVKCPSKYQGEGSDDYRDMREHEEAVSPTGT